MGATFDDTVVHVERVIAYWSRTFKNAELNYSATEREGLAAKESLIKFQPFIEGEDILLVTDHAALQWAQTWENANRRLAAWGAIFGAFRPGLEIVHRAGRLHSNVDPLSRLPRSGEFERGPPAYVAPAKDTIPAIRTDVDAAEFRERVAANQPAQKAFFADLLEDDTPNFSLHALVAEVMPKRVLALTRLQKKIKKANEKRAKELEKARKAASQQTVLDESKPRTRARTREATERVEEPAPAEAAGPGVVQDEIPVVTLQNKRKGKRADAEAARLRYEDQLEWKEKNPPPTLLVAMSPALKKRYSRNYDKDPAFKGKGLDSDERSWYAGTRFYRGKDGLLFFRDADLMPRLCVPREEQAALMRQVHESMFELAHAGFEKMYQRLSSQFYWPRMRKNVELFCATCDVCQKDKSENFTRHGLLQPHDIPDAPYDKIAFDLVTGLPWSGEYNAILVIVDFLSKHAQFIPTDSGLKTEGFAKLFVKHVVSRFGLPREFVADRDGSTLR